jgi:hypothetical protein
MTTQHTQSPVSKQAASQELALSAAKHKPVSINFHSAQVSSDGGLLVLREIEKHVGVVAAFAETIRDRRHASYVDHSLYEMLAQRIGQIACGYEDANDSDALRSDPVFKLFAGRLPESDPDLASQPTMTRLENAISRTMLYRLARTLMELFIRSYEQPPEIVVLDLDDTDDVVHGTQQLRLFNDYVDEYCFQPLHVYEGSSGRLITTILRPGKRPTGEEVLTILKRLVTYLRHAWPDTMIVIRADSHFTAPEVLAWCDAQPNVRLVLGLSKNNRLEEEMTTTRASAKKLYERYDRPVCLFHSFLYAAKTWHRLYRVIGKVEYSAQGENLRFIVTDVEGLGAQALYREVYCARGGAELRIKDHKRYLKSDRTSCHRFEANQFRLFLHSAAYVLLHTMREQLLRTRRWRGATFETLRLRLLKIGTRVQELKTRIKIEWPLSHPDREVLTTRLQLLETLRLQT